MKLREFLCVTFRIFFGCRGGIVVRFVSRSDIFSDGRRDFRNIFKSRTKKTLKSSYPRSVKIVQMDSMRFKVMAVRLIGPFSFTAIRISTLTHPPSLSYTSTPTYRHIFNRFGFPQTDTHAQSPTLKRTDKFPHTQTHKKKHRIDRVFYLL